MKMTEKTVKVYSNGSEERVLATAKNGVIVDQIISFDKVPHPAEVENIALPELPNVKPELVHVTNNSEGENKKYSLSSYSYDQTEYEYEIDDTVNDKLQFLANMHPDQHNWEMDKELAIMDQMVGDRFDRPVKKHFKAAAQVYLDGKANVESNHIDLASSSVNGFDAIHVYSGSIHVVVSANYDGTFDAFVFNEKVTSKDSLVAVSKANREDAVNLVNVYLA